MNKEQRKKIGEIIDELEAIVIDAESLKDKIARMKDEEEEKQGDMISDEMRDESESACEDMDDAIEKLEEAFELIEEAVDSLDNVSNV